MLPQQLRAYHNLIFRYDSGRYEEDYGATYQDKINTFIGIRKKVLDTSEDEIELVNSVFPEFELWWEQIRKNDVSKTEKNKEKGG